MADGVLVVASGSAGLALVPRLLERLRARHGDEMQLRVSGHGETERALVEKARAVGLAVQEPDKPATTSLDRLVFWQSIVRQSHRVVALWDGHDAAVATAISLSMRGKRDVFMWYESGDTWIENRKTMARLCRMAIENDNLMNPNWKSGRGETLGEKRNRRG